MDIHEGGCLCGAVRYKLAGEPLRALACHCRYCQQTTGSPARTVATFLLENVHFSGIAPSLYEYRMPSHGRLMTTQFCPRCGTNFGLRTERFPIGQGINTGTLDDPSWVAIDTHIFVEEALDWVIFPAGSICFAQHRIVDNDEPAEPLPIQTHPVTKSELLAK